MNPLAIAAKNITLAMALVSGSCTALSDASPCFKRSQPSLPQTQKVRPFLSNGEEGRRFFDAIQDGDVDQVGQMAQRNPQLLATHRVLQQGERASDGNIGDVLTFAIANCDARMLGALLELGADPDGTPPGLPLTYALLADDPVMATMLLQAGASPDAHDASRNTPLREVLYFERSDAVSLLVRAGANVNHADALGGTPLEAAISFGDYRSADVLMMGGANPWQVANKGSLPAHMLMVPAEDKTQESIREKLVSIAKENGPSWPPPAPEDIQRRFGETPEATTPFQQNGLVMTPEALKSIRLVASSRR